jgi:hypothetical protein
MLHIAALTELSAGEWKTTAAASASSMRLMLSSFSDSGDADGTSGVRSFNPWPPRRCTAIAFCCAVIAPLRGSLVRLAAGT